MVLTFREARRSDGRSLHAVYGDPRVTRYLSFDPLPIELCQLIIDSAVDEAEGDDREVWFVIAEVGDELVGVLRLGKTGATTAELGFAVAFAHWGQGYGTAIAAEAKRLAFEELRLEELTARHDPANVASERVLTAAGFGEPELLVADMEKNGVPLDRVRTRLRRG